MVKNALLREGLCRILVENDFDIQQSIDNIGGLDFDVDGEDHIVILDHSLADKANPRETASIINKFNKSKSVVLADKFDINLMRRFFSAGACGYIINDVPYKTFLTMMQLVSMGENVVPSQFIASMKSWDFRSRDAAESGTPYREFNLTDRDVKILRRISLGLSNKMISRELGVSEATVKVSVKNIFRKLSVHNRTQAAIIAREINLCPDQAGTLTQ